MDGVGRKPLDRKKILRRRRRDDWTPAERVVAAGPGSALVPAVLNGGALLLFRFGAPFLVPVVAVVVTVVHTCRRLVAGPSVPAVAVAALGLLIVALVAPFWASNSTSRSSCNRCQTPALFQSRSRRRQVIPDPKPNSWGKNSHGMAV